MPLLVVGVGVPRRVAGGRGRSCSTRCSRRSPAAPAPSITSKVSTPEGGGGGAPVGPPALDTAADGCCVTVVAPTARTLTFSSMYAVTALPFGVGRRRRDVDVVARRDLVGDAVVGVDGHRHRHEVFLGDRLREVRRRCRPSADTKVCAVMNCLSSIVRGGDLVDQVVQRRSRSTAAPIPWPPSRCAPGRPGCTSAPVVPLAMSLFATSAFDERRRSPARACRRWRRTCRPRCRRPGRARWPPRPSTFDDSTPRLPSSDPCWSLDRRPVPGPA